MSDRLALAVAELVDAIRAEVRAEVRAESLPADSPDRLLSVDEAAAMLGIGRSALYSEIGAGHLRTIRVGRRRLVPASAVAEYVTGVGPD